MRYLNIITCIAIAACASIANPAKAYMRVMCDSDYRDISHRFLNEPSDGSSYIEYGQDSALYMRHVVRKEMLQIQALKEYNAGHRITEEVMTGLKKTYTTSVNRDILASLNRPLGEPAQSISREGNEAYVNATYLYMTQKSIEHIEEEKKKYRENPEGTLEAYLNRSDICGKPILEETALQKQLDEDVSLYKVVLLRVNILTNRDKLRDTQNHK